jgi:hypothetical protein
MRRIGMGLGVLLVTRISRACGCSIWYACGQGCDAERHLKDCEV